MLPAKATARKTRNTPTTVVSLQTRCFSRISSRARRDLLSSACSFAGAKIPAFFNCSERSRSLPGDGINRSSKAREPRLEDVGGIGDADRLALLAGVVRLPVEDERLAEDRLEVRVGLGCKATEHI